MALAPRQLHSVLAVIGAFAVVVLLVLAVALYLSGEDADRIPPTAGLPVPPPPPADLLPSDIDARSMVGSAAEAMPADEEEETDAFEGELELQ